jgi:hypothetical protein
MAGAGLLCATPDKEPEMPDDEEVQRQINELNEVAGRYGGLVGLRGDDEIGDMQPVWIRFEQLDHPKGEIRMRLADDDIVLMNADALQTAMTALWPGDDIAE